MFDPSKVRPQLAAQLMTIARRSASAGHASGTTSERIVGALLNGRPDWLPEGSSDPLEAMRRLHKDDEGWWHTMLFVHERGWRSSIEMYEERL